MQVADIKCFCKGTNTGDFLKKDEYDSVLTSLEGFKSNFDDTKTAVNNELSSGGLSASALNFSGFSPLFEMGYQASKNVDLAQSSIDEVKSCIEDDANAHLTNEWGKYYQEVHKCTEEKKAAMESAQSYYNGLKDSDPNKSSAYSAFEKAKKDYEEHKQKESEASSKYESYAGEGSAAKALEMDFTEVSSTLSNGSSSDADLEAAKPVGLTSEQSKWVDDHIDLILEVCKETGVLPSVLLGQCLEESVLGTSDLYNNTHNLFGIRWTEGCGYECYQTAGNGCFRKYNSDEESIRDYARLLSTSQYYQGYRDGAKNWDYNQAVDGLTSYCDPPDAYLPKVKNHIDSHQFYKYDELLKNGGGASSSTSSISSDYKSLTAMSQANNRTAETTSINAKTRTFKGSSSGMVQDAIDWGMSIANDDSYGYSQNRGDHEYDCSSLAIAMYRETGVDVGGATYTGNMRECMTSTGNFEWIPGDPDPSTLQPGDIVLDEDSHTEIYIGDGKLLGAHMDYSGGSGDPSGEEIDVGDYYSHPWDGVLRPIK